MIGRATIYSGLVLTSLEWIYTSHQLGVRRYPLTRYRANWKSGYRKDGVKRLVRDVDKPKSFRGWSRYRKSTK